ncbi:hypothetical protein GF322_00605, partial [Candidatus Dependentiae bacterium]|nr:hypothetical protein [Candidatus Dependentiae bacterium]
MSRIINYKLQNYELFNKEMENFSKTLGFSLLESTILTPAKGGSLFKESKLKQRKYSDMPYWVHILNGILGTFLFMEKDGDLIELVKKNPKILKIFIVSFCFHDVNKLIKEKNLEEAVDEDLIEIMGKYKVVDYFGEYKKYLEDIKYLILNVEKSTIPLAFSNTSPSLNQRILNRLKKYLNFADLISFNEIHNIKDLFKHIKNLILKKRLPNIDIQYFKIDKNIYKGLSLAVYHKIEEKLCDKIIFRMRDGFIYKAKKDFSNFENIAKEIIDDIN